MDTTMTSTVTAITPSDVDQAVAVIVLAFSADPAARWTYPDPHQYLTHFPAIVRAFGGKAFAHGTGYHVSRFAGAALWLPPGIHPDEEALGAALQRSWRQSCKRRCSPSSSAWVGIIRASPTGICRSSASTRSTSARDMARRSCSTPFFSATETTRPRTSSRTNLRLYERHGFEMLDTIQVGSSPPIFPMLRAAH